MLCFVLCFVICFAISFFLATALTLSLTRAQRTAHVLRPPPRAPARLPELRSSEHPVAHHLRGSSLNRALDVVGDWWTQRILRECFLGVRKFDVFQSRLGVPRQTLTVRLRALVRHGILDTARGGYRLTPRGLALYPWALMIWRWTRTWSDGVITGQPLQLTHLDCGHLTTPVFACSGCGDEAAVRDVDYRDAPGQRAPGAAARHTPGPGTRWAGGRFVNSAVDGARHSAFVTADRWTHLILSAVFLGCRSFERIEREMGIAPNILAHRLALLVEAGFLEKRRGTKDARRFVYALTDRSRDVFPLTIALVQWADAWLAERPGLPGHQARHAPPMLRIHRACGASLHAEVRCSHCGVELLPHRVSFHPAPDDESPSLPINTATRSPT